MRNGIHFIRGSQWIALAALFLLCTIIADAETITYNFSIDDFEITRENGVTFVKSREPLVSYGDSGTPVLPVCSKQILCPYKKDISAWSIALEKTLVSKDVMLNENTCFIPDSINGEVKYPIPETSICSKSYDIPISVMSGINGLHGLGYRIVRLNPFHYDAEKKYLYLYTSITIDIEWGDCTDWGILPRIDIGNLKVPLQDDAETFGMESMSTNLSTYPDPIRISEENKLDYLIVTVDSLKPALKDLLVWRRSLGLKAEIVSVEDISGQIPGNMELPLRIKTYIRDCFRDKGLEYVTFVGNVDQVPTKYFTLAITVNKVWKETIPSDVYYSALDGELTWETGDKGYYGDDLFNYVDFFPDIVLSRIPASNSEEISEFTKKIIRYEKYFDSIRKMPSVLYAGGYCYYNNDEDGLSDAHMVARESSVIAASCNISYDFVFDTGTTLGEQDYMGYVYDADSIFSEALQSGYDLVSVQTHGEKYRWKDPLYFSMASADKLCNRHSSVILTAACETAAFDNAYGCLGSSLLLNPSGGCVAYIGSSRSSWYSISKAEGLNVFSPLLITNMISDWCVNPDHSIGKVFLNSKRNSKYAEDNRYFWLYFSNCMLGDSYQKSYGKLPATLEFVPVYDKGRFSLKSVGNNPIGDSISYIIKNIDTDNYSISVIKDLNDVPLDVKEFTVSVAKENCLPYVVKVAVARDRVIDSSVEISGDIILLGPNLRISGKGSLTLHGKEIIQTPGILVDSGGNLNINYYDKG